jgi:hypothetical protein
MTKIVPYPAAVAVICWWRSVDYRGVRIPSIRRLDSTARRLDRACHRRAELGATAITGHGTLRPERAAVADQRPAGPRGKKGEKFMAWLHARHAVADFEKWKPAFAATAVPRRKRFFVFAVEGNRNDLLVMEEFDTREHARAWIDSADHREAMARSGVSGAPEILLLEELEEGPG